MRRDNRPYWIRRAREWAERTYARLYLEPSFDAVGPGLDVARPWDIDVFGPNIRLGAHVHLRAAIGARIRLSTWQTNGRDGEISIGDYVLISPGVRIVSSERITIGSNTMIASYCYISDSDWHDTYDRTADNSPANIPTGPGMEKAMNTMQTMLKRDLRKQVFLLTCVVFLRNK